MKLQKLNKLLSLIPFGGTISPYYLSSESGIAYDTTLRILTILANRELINPVFILKCDNEDEDLIHKYQFSSEEELINFIKTSKSQCPNCDEKLETSEISVFFTIKSNSPVKYNE